MLLCLPSEVESTVELRAVYHQDGIISLHSPIDHVRNVLLVTRGVQEHYPLPVVSNIPHADIDGHSFVSFILVLVHHPSKFKGLSPYLFGLLLVLVDLCLRDGVELLENLTCQSRFS